MADRRSRKAAGRSPRYSGEMVPIIIGRSPKVHSSGTSGTSAQARFKPPSRQAKAWLQNSSPPPNSGANGARARIQFFRKLGPAASRTPAAADAPGPRVPALGGGTQPPEAVEPRGNEERVRVPVAEREAEHEAAEQRAARRGSEGGQRGKGHDAERGGGVVDLQASRPAWRRRAWWPRSPPRGPARAGWRQGRRRGRRSRPASPPIRGRRRRPRSPCSRPGGGPPSAAPARGGTGRTSAGSRPGTSPGPRGR